MTTKNGLSPVGKTYANIQVPEKLHDAMKVLRQIRSNIECADVKLYRIYREAIEQYLGAKPQQQLLKEWNSDGSAKTGRGPRTV